MKHPVVPVFLLLLLAPLSAKEPPPWNPRIETVLEHAPAEERIYAWRGGGWALTDSTGYGYGALGELVHVDAWSAGGGGFRYQGTWSWEFAYGSGSILTEVRERVLGESGWRDTLRAPLLIRQAFPAANGVKESVEFHWENGKVGSGYKYRREYDPTGREMRRILFGLGPGGWTESQRTVYEYDAQGRLLRETMDAYLKSEYVYDAEGDTLSYVRSLWESGDWRVIDTKTWEYGPEGRPALILIRRSPAVGESRQPADRLEYGYPSPGARDITASAWDGSRWVPQSRQSERVDSHGNVLERIVSAHSGSGWTEELKFDFGYDARGNVLERSDYAKEGAAWVLTGRLKSAYDAHDREISRIWRNYGKDVKTFAMETGLRYDEAGRLAETVYRELSPEGAVTGGEKLTYAYAGATPLAPRPPASRSGRRFEAAPRGSEFLIRENGAFRDLKGRKAAPR